jgi:hypothetical protein
VRGKRIQWCHPGRSRGTCISSSFTNRLTEANRRGAPHIPAVGMCGILADILLLAMRNIFRFLWNATRGHHLAPWRSPYLRWRIETYSGVKMQSIGFPEFCGFLWHERSEMVRFLQWTGHMDRYARTKPKNL